MSIFSDNALTILKTRYFAWIDGKQETEEDFLTRISLGNERYRHELIEPLVFLPNSPTLFNVGVSGGGTLSACFKFDVGDTMMDADSNGIMDTATKASMVIKWGGGVGYYLGNIRPKNSIVNSTHGKAMGPVALLKFYHSMASMLTQSGKREAAQMGILPATHPDILEFITCKDDNPQSLSTFNISVSLTDEFMEKAVVSGTAEHQLLRAMAASAWKTGDPGVYFVTSAERDNPTPQLGILSGTNPCGEVPLLNNEPCNLGSINLRRLYNQDTVIDYGLLEKITRLSVRYLDDVLDRNHFPVSAVSDAAFLTRKLGLGVCGWADLLALANIHYASSEATELLEKIMNTMRRVADEESYILAREKGSAPCFGAEGKRNATTLCLAPTGTIAILMGASSGIEPHYLRSWTRTTGDGHILTEQISVLEEIKDFIPQTAMEIPWEWHIAHQAAAQKHVDLAVSKTINMPFTATEEDIYNAYVLMWKSGVKGGTIYRDGCRDVQVLNSISEEEYVTESCPECNGPVRHSEQCIECAANCGWTACSI